MKLIDAKNIQEVVKVEVTEFYKDKQAKVVILNASDDVASEVYCDKKQKAFTEVGVECLVLDLDEYTTTEDMIDEIMNLNENDSVTGIMVQSPVYDHIDFGQVVNSISPIKDIDGLHAYNQGLQNYTEDSILPATAEGVKMILESNQVELEGKIVVIFGRGYLVADPLAKWLENRNATVIKVHTKTDGWDKFALLKRADIIISCVGKDLSHELHPSECPCCEMLIGVGFRYENGKQLQDFNIDDWKDQDCMVTNRINATGTATVSALLINSVVCYGLQQFNKGEVK